jgi:biopolymer transport protein ExbB
MNTTKIRFRALATLAVLVAASISPVLLPRLAIAQSSPAPVAAAATVAPLPAQAAPAATKEVVDNPYGLEAVWKGGDFVAKGTLGILAIMSIGSWYIIFTKFYEQFKLTKQGQAANKGFWDAGGIAQAIDTLDQTSAFHFIAKAGEKATQRHDGLLGYIDLSTWITLSLQRAIDVVQARLQNGLAFLATVGSTAPFVGLFGTVWGIYHALTAIGIAGQASIDKVAGPVGESLIMTALGLFVAVPAVLGYNWLIRRNKVALDEVRGFGAELHSVLLGAAAKRGSDAPTRVVHGIRAISI